MGKMDKIQMLMNDLNSQLQQQGYNTKTQNGASSSTSNLKECWTPETMVSAAIGTKSTDDWPSQNYFRSSWSIQDNMREFWIPSKDKDSDESIASSQSIEEDAKAALRKSRRRKRRIITLFGMALLIAILVMVVLVYTMYKEKDEKAILVNNYSTNTTHNHNTNKSSHFHHGEKTNNDLELQYKNLLVLMQAMQNDMKKYKSELTDIKNLYAECKSTQDANILSRATTASPPTCQPNNKKEKRGTSNNGNQGRSPKSLPNAETGIKAETTPTPTVSTKSGETFTTENNAKSAAEKTNLQPEMKKEGNNVLSTASPEEVVRNVPTTEKSAGESQSSGEIVSVDEATQVDKPKIQDLTRDKGSNSSDDANKNEMNKNDNEQFKDRVGEADNEGSNNEKDKKNTNTNPEKNANENVENEGSKKSMTDKNNEEKTGKDNKKSESLGKENDESQNKKSNDVDVVPKNKDDVKPKADTEMKEHSDTKLENGQNAEQDSNPNFQGEKFSDDSSERGEKNDTNGHIYGKFWEDLDGFLKDKNGEKGSNGKSGDDGSIGMDNAEKDLAQNEIEDEKSSLEDKNNHNGKKNDDGKVEFSSDSDPQVTDNRRKRRKKSKWPWRFFECVYEYVSKKVGNYPKDFELAC